MRVYKTILEGKMENIIKTDDVLHFLNFMKDMYLGFSQEITSQHKSKDFFDGIDTIIMQFKELISEEYVDINIPADKDNGDID